jgi:scyllo-inositol 2-dehydrogenase (NADP+)
MSTQQIKVGTIGYGGAFNMGREHLQGLLRHEGFVATAVCDLDPARLAIAQDEFPGIETYTDLDEMLAKSSVELLVVILPHNAHFDVSLKCLKAGRHVIVEKPFTITVEEADTLIAEARKQGKMISTYHNRHWDPIILTLKEHLHEIGRPYKWVSHQGNWSKPRDWWRSSKEVSGGIVYDWGAHYMEYMLQVMPYELTEISGYQLNEVWDYSNEDEVTVIARFGEHGFAQHTATSVDCTGTAGVPTIRLVGTEGALVCTSMWEPQTGLKLYKPDAEGKVQETVIPMVEEQRSLFYQNIADHLFRGAELIISPEHARRVIQILDYGNQSAVSGQAIKAKYA